MKTIRSKSAAVVLALALPFTACGGDNDGDEHGDDGDADHDKDPAAASSATGKGGSTGGNAGASGSAAVKRAEYSELCAATADCADGLECAAGVCTASCSQNADCSKFGASSLCVNRCFEACQDTNVCQRLDPALKCVLHAATMGTCRQQ